MLFARRFKRFFAILALLVWAHLDIYTAYAIASQAVSQLSSLKTTPVSYRQSPAEDPLPAQELNKLFDRNPQTSYAPDAPALVDVNWDRPQVINELRIHGSASYRLTVQQQVNGQWLDVEALTNLDLSMESDQWHRYPSGMTTETDALRLQLVPLADAGDEQGIREIEFWSPGQHEPVQSGKALLILLDGGSEVSQGRRYQAEPASGVIGPDEGEHVDFAQDNVFLFDLAYQPEQIKRAYLSYDLAGLAYWTGAIRSINEQAAMGGYVLEPGEGGRSG